MLNVQTFRTNEPVIHML